MTDDGGQTAEELRARIADQERAMQAVGVGTWEWEPRSGLVRWSPAFEELMGVPPGSFDGRYGTVLDLVHPDDLAMVEGRLAEAMAGERDYDVVLRIVRPDGAVRYLHTAGFVVRDAQGEPTRLVGSSVDVTERTRDALQLEETTNHLAYILDTSPIALFAGIVEDDEYQPTYVSSNSDRVQGWEARAYLSGEVSWIDLIHPDDRDRVLAENARALVDGHSEWESRLRRPDGTYGAYRTVLRVRDEPDGTTRYVGCTLDVTESHRMEDQLRRAQKMEAVGQLAGGVAHDFNNLLQAISGYTTTAREASEPSGEVDKALVEVERAAAQATALVQQLLAFSRQEELRPVTVDVAGAIEALYDLLETTAGPGVRLDLQLAPAVGSVRLGQGQLEQVLLNLVVNARDAMSGSGELAVIVRPVELAAATPDLEGLPPGAYVHLSVADTGEGMSTEARTRAFEPFFTTKPVGTGTGLGLATAYGIVAKAGGHVGIRSEPGEGTTIDLYLPRTTAVAGDVVEPSAPEPSAPGTAEGPSRQGNLLLVEDQAQVRELLATALGRLGYEILVAEDGLQALDLVEREAPDLDLLITDVVMPGRNGLEVAELLRQRYPHLGVILMSGYADVPGAREPSSWRGFLQKPFSIAELVAEVGRILA